MILQCNTALTLMHFVNQMVLPNTAVPKSDGYFDIAVRKAKQEILPGIEREIMAYGVHDDDDASFRTPGQHSKVRWINKIDGLHPLAS